MQSKLKYFAHIKNMGARPEQNCFRVYAYSEHAMRPSAWKSIFKEPVYVEKIHGKFNENTTFSENLKKGRLSEWVVRPFR
jgi:hypothetical protein